MAIGCCLATGGWWDQHEGAVTSKIHALGNALDVENNLLVTRLVFLSKPLGD